MRHLVLQTHDKFVTHFVFLMNRNKRFKIYFKFDEFILSFRFNFHFVILIRYLLKIVFDDDIKNRIIKDAIHMPPWRNRLARSAVNRKVGGSSPPGGE